LSFIIELLGAVALLLWGLRMVRNGVMSAFGPAIKRRARESENRRVAPFLSGFFAALALQSSTATAMIAANFTAKHVIASSTAFVIILGADLGTAVAAIIASQKITTLAPGLIALGIFGFLNSDGTKARGIFRAIGGVGLVLLSLSLISANAEQFTDNPTAANIIAVVLELPILAILVGIILTYLAHSSLAIILLTATGLAGGLFDTANAVYLVIGANIGSGLLPFLSNLKSKHAARVAVTANLGLRSGVAICLAYGWQYIPFEAIDIPLALPLMIHFGLNAAVGIIGLLFVSQILWLVQMFVAMDDEDNLDIAPKFLDNAEINKPSQAIALAKREALVMAEIAQDMVERSKIVLSGAPGEEDETLARLDDGLDRLFEAIKLYVAQVLRQPLSEEDTRKAMDILSFTANMEHVGDVVDGNLLSIAKRKRKLHTQFSEEGRQEINELYDSVIDNFQLAVSTFLTEDRDLARQLFKAKAEVRELEQRFLASHMERLGSGVSDTVRTSSLHIDVIRDLRRINSHLTAVAYPVLIASGEVPKTKWKKTVTT